MSSIDVYTLAATFYYAVTGERPTPSMQRKLDENSILIPPKQIHGQLSEHINEAILEGMALEKEDRPQSMSAWLALLEPPQPPPPVAPQYRQEVIKLTPGLLETPQTPPPISSNVRRYRDKSRQIPWISLTILFLAYGAYGAYGAIIPVTKYSFWGFAMVWSVADVMDEAAVRFGLLKVSWAIVLALAVLWLWFVLLPVAGTETIIVTGTESIIVTGTMMVAVAVTVVWARKQLKKDNFSLVHQFLILSGVSLSGLFLGFLFGFLITLLFGS